MSVHVSLHAVSDCVNETYNDEQDFRQIFFFFFDSQMSDSPRSDSSAAWKSAASAQAVTGPYLEHIKGKGKVIPLQARCGPKGG